jgi:Metallo-beta-lactamase superfamily
VNIAETLADDHLSIVVFGPGFGESIALRGPDGRWLVVDSARDPDSEHNPALSLLRAVNARPELLILTHAHEDHTAGFAELVQRQDGTAGLVGCVPASLPSDDDPLRQADTGAALRTGRTRLALSAIQARWDMVPAARWILQRGGTQALGPVDIEVLSPRKELVGVTGTSRNHLSAALLLRWRDATIVLGADLPTPEWHRVDRTIDLGHHQLYKVAHHGSSRSQHDRLGGEPQPPKVWIVTPWTMAGKHLPRLGDREDASRLLSRVDRIELTSPPVALTAEPDLPIGLSDLHKLAERSTFGGNDLVLEYDDQPRSSLESWVAAVVSSDGAVVALHRGQSAVSVVP